MKNTKKNDDEEDDEANYREFEEIKEMALYFRDRALFYLDWLELSEGEIQREEERTDYFNDFLQLHYSLENLQTLREFKEKENEDYQESLNDEKLQNDLREWRDLKTHRKK
ncbi:hypothetical protein H500_01670 [Helicobacter pylori CG-IMSS-2012]|nr:hypothetical protein H500_01670 [Helicobacter pylori CG-IMSS-2012]